jgi:hypothetical protein
MTRSRLNHIGRGHAVIYYIDQASILYKIDRRRQTGSTYRATHKRSRYQNFHQIIDIIGIYFVGFNTYYYEKKFMSNCRVALVAICARNPEALLEAARRQTSRAADVVK